MPVKIAKGMAVRIHVTLTAPDGTVIESSDRSGPVDYIHGQGAMLPGLEKVLEGLGAGDARDGTIPAKDAFGTEESLPTKAMPRAEFPKDAKLEAGMAFQAKGPHGEPVTFKVVKVGDKEVTVRFLHPLSGKDIKFAVKVIGVKDPAVARPPAPPAEALELTPDELKEEK
jgi:FKBP-type peptidyl-prolyl cis-trans isomerase SlyD